MNKRLVLVGVMSILCSYPDLSAASMQSPRQQYYKSIVAQINSASDEEAALDVFAQFLKKTKLRKDGTPTNPQDREAYISQIIPALTTKLSAETLTALAGANPKPNAQDIAKSPVYQNFVKTRVYKGAIENITPAELKLSKEEVEKLIQDIKDGKLVAPREIAEKLAKAEATIKELEAALELAKLPPPPPFNPEATLTQANTEFAKKLKDYGDKLKAAGKNAELKALQDAVK